MFWKRKITKLKSLTNKKNVKNYKNNWKNSIHRRQSIPATTQLR